MLKHWLIDLIGHVSGLSDAQLRQIEKSLPATKALFIFPHHENRSPTHGYAATREAAMSAFAKSWRALQARKLNPVPLSNIQIESLAGQRLAN
jgi:hypothetical protein